MYLPGLARDLYKSRKEVEQLEQQLQEAAASQQQELKDQLRQAKAELTQLLKVMEGRKEQSRSSLNKPSSRF